MHVKRAHVLGSIFRWTSAQYNSDVQTADCLYNECIRKICSFQRKIFTCEVASFGLFQNRLLDSAGLALKRKVRLTYAQTRAWLQRIERSTSLDCLCQIRIKKGIFSGAIWFFQMQFPSFLFIQMWLWSLLQIVFGIL